ncbi:MULTISPECIES: alpha-ketoglutarate-dependent dioxygenase AlkB family protein [Vibrio]|uniref:Alpha-ketoglutarate-dependent dioxygenase AlkB n=1 Tax=Vibrio mediterranei TaxID=689 RepID=A0A3G4VH68_9VIBR|nr:MULTISPECIES: alpha-ketoglutarate-dependent dioxygenase AlkB [Vibrio]AYV24177.1 alpha-ketoglutarate-dependent dioxygenase AlkB [Vibrio mediterranei]EDL55752.1 Alkylated DNA repair protein [Vibrio mediterranei AK1]MDA0106758.1 alpha-ketoglutarate-dependent dioxygenase AlkB [Vibrio sp. La 4.2.2]USE03058.1 alpha-ketoglutarate-dependent dioxygenase AlkB [Vibrio sp. SCSIO 43133]
MELAQGRWTEVLGGKLLWIPDFIDVFESLEWFRLLNSELQWREDKIMMFGKWVTIPRLQAWYGDASYQYSNLTLDPLPWTPHLEDLRRRCELASEAPFNSVLANLYRTGQDSNGWHSDNEPELGNSPVIASLSFGGTRRFALKHRETKQKITLDLPSGSLLVMAGDTQHHWLHTVPKTARHVEPRINLTFRHIYSK